MLLSRELDNTQYAYTAIDLGKTHLALSAIKSSWRPKFRKARCVRFHTGVVRVADIQVSPLNTSQLIKYVLFFSQSVREIG